MFFQLQEVSRLTKATDELEKAKDKLNSFILDAYRPEQAVKKSLGETIASVLRNAERKLQALEQVEQDALGGYLVPSYLEWDQLTDRTELPEWTQVVFEKEFEKQKKALDQMARKTYTAHALTEAKDKLTRQINSFRVLCDRYKALAQQDEVIDIMAEAEKLKALTAATNEKYLTYCNLIASRLTAFTEEMVAKCCNFSAEVGSFVGKTTNAWVHPEEGRQASQQQRQSYEGSWLARANRTLDRPQYRYTQGTSGALLKPQPRWLKSVTSDFYS